MKQSQHDVAKAKKDCNLTISSSLSLMLLICLLVPTSTFGEKPDNSDKLLLLRGQQTFCLDNETLRTFTENTKNGTSAFEFEAFISNYPCAPPLNFTETFFLIHFESVSSFTTLAPSFFTDDTLQNITNELENIFNDCFEYHSLSLREVQQSHIMTYNGTNPDTEKLERKSFIQLLYREAVVTFNSTKNVDEYQSSTNLTSRDLQDWFEYSQETCEEGKQLFYNLRMIAKEDLNWVETVSWNGYYPRIDDDKKKKNGPKREEIIFGIVICIIVVSLAVCIKVFGKETKT